MRAVAVLVFAGAVLTAAPAAAAVPYEKQWKWAAKQARFSATPAPAVLAGLRAERYGGGGRAISGQYSSGKPDEPECRRVTDRVRFRQTTGTFTRAADGTWLFMSFFGRVPRPCEAPEPDPLRGTVRLGRVKVLGTRLRLEKFPLDSAEVGYRVHGRLRSHRFNLQVNYASEDPGRAEVVRIARGLRWVRRR